ncbi:hypothetical protein [Paracoccus benzoatiresistens]|uniref:Uncharacterized protein n=1 Tax=Paracoccus benzoatiresistens TaxID=2997341 RepID=A0ABT4J1Y6_9RHOB|nr:hypothetical protein [Paracoccus sp. EF6]MCZ0960924.1 hypothetical protein [Paracoccus sp. EF6]
MDNNDDGPFADREPDPRLAELLGDVGAQPIPPRLKALAEELKRTLAEAGKRRDD